MLPDRRHFPRLQLSEEAFAVDEKGRQLGRVCMVGGGGLQIRNMAETTAPELTPGCRVRLTILEPESRTSHTIDVVVRYRDGDKLGAEFVTGEDAGSE